MAVNIPDKTALGVRNPSPSRGFVDVPQSPVGGALTRAGGDTQRLGLAVQQEGERRAAYDADSEFIRFEAHWRDQLGKRFEKEELGATGFARRFSNDFNSAAEEFYQNVPDSQSDVINTRLTNLGVKMAEAADSQERQSTNIKSKFEISDSQRMLMDRSMENPQEYNGNLDRINTLIANAPGLDVAERESLSREASRAFALADIRRRAGEGDYNNLMAELGGDASFYDKLRYVESSFRVDAKNHRSSATGLSQFTDGTWMEVMARNAPQLMEGRTKAEILELRKDEDIDEAMLQAFTMENADVLSRNGVPINDTTLYLAHFLGPTGAVQLLGHGVDTPVKDILAPSKINANPFLKGMTVGDLYNEFARKMGDAASEAPTGKSRYDVLDWTERDKMRITLANQQRTQEIRQRNDIKDALARRVYEDPTFSKADVLSFEHTLGNKNVVSLFKEIDKRDKGDNDYARGLRMLDGGDKGNPFNGDDRDAVDAVFKKNAGGGAGLNEGDEQAVNALRALAEASGIAPPSAVETIRGGLASTDPEVVQQSLENAAMLEAVVGSGLSGITHGSELLAAAGTHQNLTQGMGYSSSEATKRYMASRAPAAQNSAGTSRVAAAELLEISENELLGSFRGWKPLDTPSATPAMKAGMVATYNEFAQEMYQQTGDEDVAKAYAMGKIEDMYGVTKIAGSSWRGQAMRHPPEKVYPAIGDSHDWVQKQLLEDMAEFTGGEVLPEDIILTTTPDTLDDIAAGKAPRYQVGYFTEREGQRVYQVMNDLWKGDYVKARREFAIKKWIDEIALQKVDDVLRSGDVPRGTGMDLTTPLQGRLYIPRASEIKQGASDSADVANTQGNKFAGAAKMFMAMHGDSTLGAGNVALGRIIRESVAGMIAGGVSDKMEKAEAKAKEKLREKLLSGDTGMEVPPASEDELIQAEIDMNRADVINGKIDMNREATVDGEVGMNVEKLIEDEINMNRDIFARDSEQRRQKMEELRAAITKKAQAIGIQKKEIDEALKSIADVLSWSNK